MRKTKKNTPKQFCEHLHFQKPQTKQWDDQASHKLRIQKYLISGSMVINMVRHSSDVNMFMAFKNKLGSRAIDFRMAIHAATEYASAAPTLAAA